MTDPRTPASIRLRALPAVAGLFWIRRGFRTFWRRPGGFMGLFGVVLLFLLALSILPPAVAMFAPVLMPLLSLGFMLGTQGVLNDLPVRPANFWIPLSAGSAARQSLLRIGMVYAAVFLAVYFLGDRLDGGEARTWLQAMLTPNADGSMPEPVPLGGLGTAVLLLNTFSIAIVSIPLFHAPALVHWGRQGAAQAMFSSIVALWRTRSAFLVYLLGWCALFVLFIFGVVLLGAVLGSLPIAIVLMTPAYWALSTIFYITTWFGFVDTFEIRAPA